MLAAKREELPAAKRKITELEQQVQHLTSYSKQREELRSCKDQLEASQDVCRNLEEVIERLRSTVVALERESEETKICLRAAQGKVSQLETVIKALNETSELLQPSLSTAQKQISELQADKTLLQQTNASSEEQLNRLTAELQLYKGDVGTISTIGIDEATKLTNELANTLQQLSLRKVSYSESHYVIGYMSPNFYITMSHSML
jgi:chromosome segregation ATPase